MSVTDYGLSKRRRDILVRLLEQLSGAQAVWANEPDVQFDPISKAKITLRIRSISTSDYWEKITVVTPTGYETRLGNQTQALIEMKIETYDTEVYADQIFLSVTTRMYRDRFRAILHSANCALADNGDYTDMPTHYDNRVFSCGIGTLKFNFADLDPLTDTLDTFIDTVAVSGTVSQVDNTSGTSTDAAFTTTVSAT